MSRSNLLKSLPSLIALLAVSAVPLAWPQSGPENAAPLTQTQNFVAKFINTTGGLGNSLIFDNGSNVGIGKTSPGAKLDVNGSINSTTGFKLGGNSFAFGNNVQGNVFLGFFSGNLGTVNASFSNTGVGGYTLNANLGGSSNTAVGYYAMRYNTNGELNAALGTGALQSNTTGAENTACGYGAALANTTGNDNTAVGSGAGDNVDLSVGTGNGDTSLGAFAEFSTGTLSNATAIGYQAEVAESNAMVLGSIAGVNNASATVNVGIGTTTPDNNLTVNGSADKPGGGSWGTYSDGRLKTVNGSFSSGLSQILQLHPIRYHYKPDNALGIRDPGEHVGIVAQDVQRVIPEAVTENNKGYLLLNNDPVIWSMVNAIKEQQELIRKQQAQIARLSSQVRAIRASLKTGGRSVPEVQMTKAQLPPLHQ